MQGQNLHRQPLFNEDHAQDQLPKAVAAAKTLGSINSEVKLDPRVEDLRSPNAEKLLKGYTVILDGTDNFETRLLINDVAVKLGIPWIYAGAVGASFSVMPVRPGQSGCLRCMMPGEPNPGSLPTCDSAGVINPAPGLVGALEAAFALRLLATETFGDPGLVTGDVWRGTFETVKVEKRAECPVCGHLRFDFLNGNKGSSAGALCGREAVQIVPEEQKKLSLNKLLERLKSSCDCNYNGYLLTIENDALTMTIFPNGRAIVQGTSDQSVARQFYSRYVGN